MTAELHAQLLRAPAGSDHPFELLLTRGPVVDRIPVDSVGQGRRIAAQRGATFNF